MKRVVGELAPVIHANVAAVLLRRRVESRGRDLRQEIEDLTQDVFERLLANNGQRLLSWDPNRGTAAAFFGLIARNQVHNVLDSRRKSPWTEDPASMDQLEPGDSRLERALHSRSLLRTLGLRLRETLSSRDWRLFELMHIEHADDGAIRAELGLSRDALYQARRRMLHKVREIAAEVDGSSEVAS